MVNFYNLKIVHRLGTRPRRTIFSRLNRQVIRRRCGHRQLDLILDRITIPHSIEKELNILQEIPNNKGQRFSNKIDIIAQLRHRSYIKKWHVIRREETRVEINCHL